MIPTKSPGFAWLQQQVGYDSDECLLWPYGFGHNGYGSFYGEGRPQYAHRWMCERARGPAPSACYHAAHECGNKLCVNPRHMVWKTNAENQLDRRRHGTAKNGPGTRWKLTPEQVAVIKAAKGVVSVIKLADLFDVNEATIRQIHNGQIWRTGQYETGRPRLVSSGQGTER
jgi:hypothetical protein